MSYKLVTSKPFQKAYRKFAGRNNTLKIAIKKSLQKLVEDPYEPTLRTHKLSGQLAAYLACYCGYDCRIIFIIQHPEGSAQKHIILLDIGTHDDVY